MKENLRVNFFVSGRVQGVFFRLKTKQKAEKLGIFGWVRNLPQGRVEVLAEGEKEKIKDLIGWAKKGPIFAKVDSLEIKEQEFKGEFNSFEIKR